MTPPDDKHASEVPSVINKSTPVTLGAVGALLVFVLYNLNFISDFRSGQVALSGRMDVHAEQLSTTNRSLGETASQLRDMSRSIHSIDARLMRIEMRQDSNGKDK